MQEFKLTEYPDKQSLNTIYLHQDIWRADRKRYKKYKTLCTGYGKKTKKTPQLTVSYKRKEYNGVVYGRAYPSFNDTVKPMCATTMWNRARATLFSKTDYDVDIRCCHPELTLNLIRQTFNKLNGEEFEFEGITAFKYYVSNRDDVIENHYINNDTIIKYNKNNKDNKTKKDLIKILYVIIMYGGKITSWMEEFNLTDDDIKLTGHINEFEKDVLDIYKYLLKNPDIKTMYNNIYKQKKEDYDNKISDKYPTTPRVFSIILQEYEFKIINYAMNFIKTNHKDFHISVYAYDGFQVHHKTLQKNDTIDKKVKLIIDNLNKKILDDLDFGILFLDKPFKDALDDIDINAMETDLPELKPFLYSETFDLQNTKKIDCRYLSMCSNEIIRNVYFHKITHIKSHLGTGKTTLMKELIDMFDDCSFLYFAPRRSFADEIAYDLKEYSFVNYQDEEFNGSNNRVVIQMESLYKLKKHDFDFVIVDEVNSCLKQFNSFETHGKHLKYNHITFADIFKKSTRFISMDAFLNNQAVDVLNKLLKSVNNTKISFDMQTTLFNYKQIMDTKKSYDTFGNSVIIENIHQPYNREAFELNICEFENTIIEKIQQGEKCCVVSSTEKFATHIYNKIIQDKISDVNDVILYTGKMDEKDKKFKNIDEVWGNKKVLIYTPIITIGVSFNPDDITKRFDTLFLYGHSMSCCVRDMLQASLRVRQLNKNIMYFSLSCNHNRNAHLTAGVSNNLDNLTRKQDFTREHDYAFEPCNEWIKYNFAYNMNEDAISGLYYDAVFYEYLKRCGYTVNVPVAVGLDKEKIDMETYIPTYEEIPRFNFPEYEDVKKYSGNRTTMDNYGMVRFEMSQFFNENIDFETLYQLYKRGLYKKLCVEFTETYENLKENEIEKYYDANAKLTFEKKKVIQYINNMFGVENSWKFEVDSLKLKDKLPELIDVLNDNKVLFNLRGMQSKKKDTDKFKWVVASLKKVYENWTCCEMKSKRKEKKVNGKRLQFWNYNVNTTDWKDAFYPMIQPDFKPTEYNIEDYKLNKGICHLQIDELDNNGLTKSYDLPPSLPAPQSVSTDYGTGSEGSIVKTTLEKQKNIKEVSSDEEQQFYKLKHNNVLCKWDIQTIPLPKISMDNINLIDII
jgi:hypothetical protein